MESNHLPSGYEPPALTDELHPHKLPAAVYVDTNEVSLVKLNCADFLRKYIS
jgi:hypothetical protein